MKKKRQDNLEINGEEQQRMNTMKKYDEVK